MLLVVTMVAVSTLAQQEVEAAVAVDLTPLSSGGRA